MATSEKLNVRIVSRARADSDSDAIFSLQVPNSLLLAWHNKVKDSTVPSYIEQLNSGIHNSAVAINVHCERLERRVTRRATNLSMRKQSVGSGESDAGGRRRRLVLELAGLRYRSAVEASFSWR